MKPSTLRIATQIVLNDHDSAVDIAPVNENPKTLDDLLNIWANQPTPQLPMLRTTCSLLAAYIGAPTDRISIDSVRDAREGFRTFLAGRKYKENSVRTYVNHVRILLKSARKYGWKPTEVPEAWRGVFAIASTQKCVCITRHLARLRKSLNDVLVEDVDQWVDQRTKNGYSYRQAQLNGTRLWRILRDCGYTGQLPKRFLREKNYGIALEQFPPDFKREIQTLLAWKQAKSSLDRPKGARHRPVTSKLLEHFICGMYGYVVNELGESGVTSLPQLVQRQYAGSFADWSINTREVKGKSLQGFFRILSAALHQHPSYESSDYGWLKPFIDGLPTESKSEVRKRKATMYLEYKVLALIPGLIRASRAKAEKKGPRHVSRVVQNELLFRWLITLPWRQRNIREMRICGPKPNLYKRKIDPFSEIDKPKWVQEEERNNPTAEFWQFHFDVEETKTGIEVSALLPRQLIGPLEEYLRDYRKHLLHGSDPMTLFINQAGTPLTLKQMGEIISTLTLRYGNRRVTPHLFRDIIAFTWLKEHPADNLTLSKMFWHKNINMVIELYGGRFNESSGVCAMESWLDEREAKSK